MRCGVCCWIVRVVSEGGLNAVAVEVTRRSAVMNCMQNERAVEIDLFIVAVFFGGIVMQ